MKSQMTRGQVMRIVHLYDKQPAEIQIKLERNSKGYNWEISYRGEDSEDVIAKIREVNERLQKEYGGAQ